MLYGQCGLQKRKTETHTQQEYAVLRQFLASEQLFAYTVFMDESYKRQLRRFYETHRRMPNYSEIMELVGFSSRASVFKLVLRLAKEGFLVKDKRGKLAPGNIWAIGKGLQVLGTIEAGFQIGRAHV